MICGQSSLAGEQLVTQPALLRSSRLIGALRGGGFLMPLIGLASCQSGGFSLYCTDFVLSFGLCKAPPQLNMGRQHVYSSLIEEKCGLNHLDLPPTDIL